MPFDVQALAHNKPALIGLGVAGAAGLYVLIKRKQATGSTTSGAGVAGGQTPYTVPSSYPDTTSTDLVQQWGQFSQNLLGDLQQAFPNSNAPNGGTGAITTTVTSAGGLFTLQGDTGGGIYLGIPGGGWAWAPSPTQLGPYIDTKHPVQLGVLTPDQATSQFGPRQEWYQLPGAGK